MKIATKAKMVWTPPYLNTALGFLGLVIIWLATHNWIAIVGGIVAGLHISVTVEDPPPSEDGTWCEYTRPEHVDEFVWGTLSPAMKRMVGVRIPIAPMEG